MAKDTIRFANGAVFDCSYLATDGQGTAWIILDGLDIVESVSVFSNPDMTDVMEWATTGLLVILSLCLLWSTGTA